MRGIKPFKLSFISRPFSWGQSHQLGVGVMGYFPLDDAPTLLSDMELWMEVPEVLGKEFLLDAGIPKSRSEFLLAGSAFQPGGEPAPVRFVRASVGDLEKTLYVIGDRQWVKGVPTEPEPFVEMPLSWSHAFGGRTHQQNPDGKGADAIEVDGVDVRPLPNVELPDRMIRSPRDEPPPAGFGPVDFVRPSRLGLAGTYDKRWLETRFPGFAEDMDWRIWNLASPDQWQDHPFRGDEKVVLEHLHPHQPRLESQLPGVRARCFVMQNVGSEMRFEEIALRLTTVWLFPSIERGIVIFHGAHPIAEDDAHDIETIMIAAERLGEPARPLSHYRDVYERRTGDDGVFEALNELDLMPEGMDGLGTGFEEQKKLTTIEQLRLKRKVAASNARVEAVRAQLVELGLDPDEHGPPMMGDVPEPPTVSEIPALIEKLKAQEQEMRAKSEERDEEREKELVTFCALTGLDVDEMKEEMANPPVGPPPFSAEGQRAKMQRLSDEVHASTGIRSDELEFYAKDEKVYRSWVEAEEGFKQAYRTGAHFQRAASAAPANASAERRAAVTEAHARGESLSDWDLTGVDLSGLDLSGADLSRSFLEAADLSAATLDGANLDEAVLARACLRGASLIDASLVGANLGHADLTGATCRGASLSEAILDETDFTSAHLEGANLTEAKFSGEMRWQGAKLAGADLSAADFLEVALGGVSLAGANLTHASFFEVDADGVDFSGATLADATFFKSSAKGARFVDAKMPRLRAIETSFEGADFKRAEMEQACLREIDLKRADLSGVRLTLADLSGALLEEAILYRIVARRSMWVRADLRRARMISADLFEAILEKADLRGTDLRGANLYGADVALMRSDEETDVHDAIQDKVRILPLREPPPTQEAP